MTWVGEKVALEAERQLADPAVVQAQLRELDERVREGSLSADEAAELEEALITRLLAGSEETHG